MRLRIFSIIILMYLSLGHFGMASGQIIISELMSRNDSTIQDDLGQFSDWVEISNTGAESVDLNGWSLTDDPAIPDKWVFPAVSINRGQFMVIYASDLDHRDANAPLHTNFKLSGDGEYLGLYSNDGRIQYEISPSFPALADDQSFGIPMGADQLELLQPDAPAHFHIPQSDIYDGEWFHPEFSMDESSWMNARLPLGFDTTGNFQKSLDLTELPARTTTAYVRIQFDVNKPESIIALSLETRFDDGFVLWLNGRRILSANAPEELDWNTRATKLVSGDAALRPEVFDLSDHLELLEGENTLAVQMLNISPLNSDLLWDGQLKARTRGDVNALPAPVILKAPTPGAVNSSPGIPMMTPPILSSPGKILTSPYSLEITHPDPEAVIRFTIDGTTPDMNSRVYSSPLAIRSSINLQVSAFRDGFQSSEIVSAHFTFLNFTMRDWHSNLPVAVFQQKSDETITEVRPVPGIFYLIPSDTGTGTDTTLWDMPEAVSHASIKVRGSSSSGRPKPSYSLELQDSLGEDRNLSLLDMPSESDWILYGPYNFDRALMRNAFIYQLSNKMGRYAPRTKFIELFVSRDNFAIRESDYMGVYVLMEKIKRDNDRIDIQRLTPEDISGDRLTGGYLFKIDRLDPGDSGIQAGGQRLAMIDPKESELTLQQRNYLTGYFNNFQNALRLPSTGAYRQFIDTGSWVDHHLINEFTKNPDGFRLSAYMHKPRNGPVIAGPVWDFDRTMGNDDDSRALNPVGWSNSRNYGWYGQLLRDPDFLQQWIDTFQTLQLNDGPFSRKSMLNDIDQMARELSEAAARNFTRWPQVAPNSGSYSREVAELKSWISRRLIWINSLYPSMPVIEPGSSPSDEPTVPLIFRNPETTIFYRTDGLDPRLPRGGRRSGNLEYPDSGSPQLEFNKTTRITARSFDGQNWSAMVDQFIVPGPVPDLVISEIHYHPSEAPPWSENDLEFVEIANRGDTTVNLHGFRLDDAVLFQFEESETDLGPGETVVIAANPEALKSHFSLTQVPVFGPFTGRLSNSGETIRLLDAADRVVNQVTWSDIFPWPVEADGFGASLTLRSLHMDSIQPENWIAANIGPSPGTVREEDDYTPVIAHIDRVENGVNDQVRIFMAEEPAFPLDIQYSKSIANPEWRLLQSIEPGRFDTNHSVIIDLAPSLDDNPVIFLRIIPSQN